jgi:hypothetical protein
MVVTLQLAPVLTESLPLAESSNYLFTAPLVSSVETLDVVELLGYSKGMYSPVADTAMGLTDLFEFQIDSPINFTELLTSIPMGHTLTVETDEHVSFTQSVLISDAATGIRAVQVYLSESMSIAETNNAVAIHGEPTRMPLLSAASKAELEAWAKSGEIYSQALLDHDYSLHQVLSVNLRAELYAPGLMLVVGALRGPVGQALDATMDVLVESMSMTDGQGHMTVIEGTERSIDNTAGKAHKAWVTANPQGLFAVLVADTQTESVLIRASTVTGFVSMLKVTF